MHGELFNIVMITTLLILSVISVSTNTWQVKTAPLPNGRIEGDKGLWKECGTVFGPDGKPIPIPDNKSGKTLRDMYPFSDSKNYICKNTESDDIGSTTLSSMKILSIGGSVFLLLSLMLLVIMPSTKKFLIPLLIGGIMIVISITLWATDNKLKLSDAEKALNAKEHYGYSWYLGLVSGVLSVLFSLMVYFNVMV